METLKLVIKPLLQHLREKFDEANPAPAPAKTSKARKAHEEAQARLEEFLTFAQSYLDKYKPMTTIMLEEGFGCTLQDGQPVCLNQSTGVPPMRDEGLGFTSGRGIGLQPSGAIGM